MHACADLQGSDDLVGLALVDRFFPCSPPEWIARSQTLRSNRPFMLAALRRGYRCFQWASADLRADKALALLAVASSHDMLQHADEMHLPLHRRVGRRVVRSSSAT